MEPEKFKIGDKVTYKRQGSLGHFNAEVVAIEKRIRIRVYGWMDVPQLEFYANVKPRSLRKVDA